MLVVRGVAGGGVDVGGVVGASGGGGVVGGGSVCGDGGVRVVGVGTGGGVGVVCDVDVDDVAGVVFLIRMGHQPNGATNAMSGLCVAHRKPPFGKRVGTNLGVAGTTQHDSP